MNNWQNRSSLFINSRIVIMLFYNMLVLIRRIKVEKFNWLSLESLLRACLSLKTLIALSALIISFSTSQLRLSYYHIVYNKLTCTHPSTTPMTIKDSRINSVPGFRQQWLQNSCSTIAVLHNSSTESMSPVVDWYMA